MKLLVLLEIFGVHVYFVVFGFIALFGQLIKLDSWQRKGKIREVDFS
jgi:hypothetical protein